MSEVKVITDFERNLTTEQLLARIAELLKMVEAQPEHRWFLDYTIRPEGKITIEIEV